VNILHITSAKTWRGGERQIQYLMAGLKDAGHSNFLMSPKASIIEFRSVDLVTAQITFKKGILGRCQNMFALVNYCKSNKIDIIHGHDSHAHTLLWLAYKFGGLKTKSIITRRLINPIKDRSIAKYNHPKIERIVCISNAVKNILAPAIKDLDRLEVIYSAIKIPFELDAGKTLKENRNFVVGYVAAFTEEKDHTTFLEVAKHLISDYTDLSFSFLLVGDGPLIENIKNDSKQVNGDFVFTGFVEEVNQSYLDMDLLLHTAKSEALGTAILDAMKHGLPIIATEVGGISEVVQNGKNGFLCEIGNYKEMSESVYRLATDRDLYDSFSKNSKAIIPKFNVTAMVTKTLELYNEVLNN
jgi:glycosyltransferase involved in cell wall biosynthesis